MWMLAMKDMDVFHKSARWAASGRIVAYIFVSWLCLVRINSGDDLVPRGCRKVFNELMEAYGVRVEPNRRRLQGETRGGVKADPVTTADLELCVPILADELRLYPAAFIRLVKLKRIVLCNNLTFGKAKLGGCTDPDSGTIHIEVATSNSNGHNLSAAFHHELFHLFDYADDEILLEDEAWSAHNAPGFEYGYLAKRADVPTNSDRLPPGIIAAYSRMGPQEDKAEVFSHMIVFAAEVDKKLEEDPFLKAKVRTLKLRLADFCSEMDNQFWESAKCRSRPKPDAGEDTNPRIPLDSG
jgi:hypothetical protein